MPASIRDVVRDVVLVAAPDELPVPSEPPRVRNRGGGDELGFGGAEVLALVTPVVWLAVEETVRLATAGAAGGVLTRVRARLARRRRAAPTDPVPALDNRQLDLVHRRVRELSAESGIVPAAAGALADAVVARLAREGAAASGRLDL